MNFQQKLASWPKDKIWKEYCGYLDLPMDSYMYIQNRLMKEQMERWKKSELGKKLLGDRNPSTIDEFRNLMPLTDYSDYADTLLNRKKEMLPDGPAVWIQTTWEGGIRPIKLAPYSRDMLDVYRHNMLTVAMLSSSHGKGDFDLKAGDRVLYGGAPLPYATGLIPSLLSEELDLEWLPDANDKGSGFSERIKEGFKMGQKGGIDYFFGIGSVANYITENFSRATGSGHHSGSVSPSIALRYLKAKHSANKTGKPVKPGDVFHLKGLISAGTDAACYRKSLQDAWGTVPMEIAAGTESTCIGAETWKHDGMVFFPDAAFYEFISEGELRREKEIPDYKPRTCLMNEICAGQNYELVLSIFHGGAFMRYRIGDMYRCVSSEPGQLPHITFLDRCKNVIDIAGFTRITEASVREAISLSKLSIGEWFINKEYSGSGIPFLHMYLEMPENSSITESLCVDTLNEHLTVYFKYFDNDYNDLKKLLGIDPLQITVLKQGTLHTWEGMNSRKFPRVNPEVLDVNDVLNMQGRMDYIHGRSLK
jgi:hypothetical protein